MKKILYTPVVLVLLSFVLLIDGCKKNTSASVNGLVQSFSVSTTINGTITNYSRSYTYDSLNRLTELQQTDSTPIFLTYASGSVTDTKGSVVIIYELNSLGLATSTNTGNTYAYNSSGYCVNSNTAAGTYTVNTVANGNIVNTQITKDSVTTAYAYTFLSTPDYRTYGEAFLGENSLNLVNTLTVGSTVYNYSYTFDSKGRVQTETSTAGSSKQVITYGYVD